jgi:predicted porin
MIKNISMAGFARVLVSVVALLFGSSMEPVLAGDPLGECCADLEERVAVLEAASARKGNAKVSLTMYGQVNSALLIWDNGVDRDAYVVDNDSRSTRMGFKGTARINHDWSAGYKIELQFEDASSVGVSEINDDNSGIGIRKSFMYVQSKTYGTFSWGLNSVATDDLTHHGFTSGTTDYVKPDLKYIRDFDIMTSAGVSVGTDWGQLCGAAMSDGDACFDIGSRHNTIRYDTPVLAGFKVSASWGEDDFWDVALRYKGGFGDFKVAAAAGYGEWEADNSNGREERNANGENSFVASGSIMHTPTGLFANAAFRNTEIEIAGGSPDSDNLFVQVGIKQKLNGLGATVVWGEYANSEDGLLTGEDRAQLFNGLVASGSDYTRWGVGVSQWIDAAALQVYALYQHHEAEIETAGGSVGGLQAFDLVVVGGVIKF